MSHGTTEPGRVEAGEHFADDAIDLRQWLAPLAQHGRLLLGVTVLAGALGAAGSYLITPTFVSTTTFLPPQQQQSVAASALSSLGALAGLPGGAVKSPADEYVALMKSVTVSDRIIDRFKLAQLYDKKYRRDTRRRLSDNVQMSIGKKDGMISVSVEDEDPARAAAMANQYVEELRQMTSVLAVSEAQQRRMFFEKQVNEVKVRLTAAQNALQGSGFNPGAMKAEPRTAADEYAKLRAEMTAADVRLQTLRQSMTETAPQVQQQAATLQALRTQVGQLEQSSLANTAAPDYVSKYREFKYQETLFDLMAKQYELARADESREGALIQVVDPAQPAELKTNPKRSLVAIGSALLGALLCAVWLIRRDRRRLAADRALEPGGP
jgi:uncharacterized protein involved in exopolysaccharide biosynthesis